MLKQECNLVMGIDVRTIIFIIGICCLIEILVFFYQYKSIKNISGTGWWLMWSITMSVFYILIGLRNIPFLLPIVIIFQDIILLAATTFIYVGVQRFFNKDVNLKFLSPFFGSFVILHLFFVFAYNDITIRTFLIDAFLAVIAFVTAVTLYKNKTRSIVATANFNTAILIIHGGIFAYRAVLIVMGISLTDMFAPTIYNYIQFFDALIVALLLTFGIIMMVGQRLHAETLEAKTHFEEIFNTSPDAAAINRLSDGMYVDCNENYLRISGYSKEDISGKSSLDINIWDSPDERLEVVRIVREKGFCENHEILFRRKDGEIITGLISAKLMNINGVSHLLSVTRDISERKKIEREIMIKNKELQKLNSEKDKFFSIIAHDLKSPFNAIVGFSELLVEKAEEKDLDGIKIFAETILQSSHRVLDLLSNLMIWSLSQTGRMKFNPEPFDLAFVIDENLLLFHDIAEQKKIYISKNLEGNMPVIADNGMISTVLRNLISNAIKFTSPDGKIIISAEKEQNEVTVSVKDTGIGIPESSLEKLFRIDENFSTSGTQNEKGTGLGLILCKEFIEKHGGKIWVDSKPGIGSTFYFTIINQTEPVIVNS